MTKVIKAQLYIPWVDTEVVKRNCKFIDNEIEGWPISYDCFEAEYGNDNEHIVCFSIMCEGHTFKDAEAFFKLIKKSIELYFKAKPKEIIKLKLERLQ